MISEDESETVEIEMKTMDWARELTEIYGWAIIKAIHQANQGLRTKSNGKFNASKLFKELDQMVPAEAH